MEVPPSSAVDWLPEVWGAAIAYAATYPPTIDPASGSTGYLVDVRIAVEVEVRLVTVQATYRSGLGAFKVHRVVVPVPQLLQEHRLGFVERGADGENFSSALLLQQYDSVESTFGWNLPDDELITDGPLWPPL